MNTKCIAAGLLAFLSSAVRAGDMVEGSGIGVSSGIPFLRNVFILLVLLSVSLFMVVMLIGATSHPRGVA